MKKYDWYVKPVTDRFNTTLVELFSRKGESVESENLQVKNGSKTDAFKIKEEFVLGFVKEKEYDRQYMLWHKDSFGELVYLSHKEVRAILLQNSPRPSPLIGKYADQKAKENFAIAYLNKAKILMSGVKDSNVFKKICDLRGGYKKSPKAVNLKGLDREVYRTLKRNGFRVKVNIKNIEKPYLEVSR